MNYEQIIFWSKFILFGFIIIAGVIGGIVSYKNFPPRRWGETLWILSTLIWFILGMLIGLLISLLIRDYWFDIYDVVNPYVNC
jgi:uncharacterized membrane protein